MLTVAACGGRTTGLGATGNGDDAGGGGGASGVEGGAGGEWEGGVGVPALPTGKVDLLFVVQNSPAMLGVSAYLQASVPAMIDRLLNPNCIDVSSNVVGASIGGVCQYGQLEFKPVRDMHVGILTSSLGGVGSTACPDSEANPTNIALSAHGNDDAELINRAGAAEAPLADAQPSNFLAWFPNDPASPDPTLPVGPPIALEPQLVGDFQELLGDTGLYGCGFSAPLEAWYRFLAQPDPYATIANVDGGRAAYAGMNEVILRQRHDFLRPDSALGVVMVVTENDRSPDPLSIGGQGWAFEDLAFPGSLTGAAPEGTTDCQQNPESTACTSCAFVEETANFAALCPNDPPGGASGYLDPSDDAFGLRFFHMKQRFGVDPQFPIARYAAALTSATVPDGLHERDATGNYAPMANCTNPIFAAALPATSTDELCELPLGRRTPGQVFLAVIGGVPHQLLQENPADANSLPKLTLTGADWTAILGADPLNYDFTGADFHMLESESARAQSACPPTAADDCDPISGREIETSKQDLQFACVFPLAAALDCTQAANADVCACAPGAVESTSPLCAKDGAGAYTATQINGRAHPTIRELALARTVPGAVVGSVCPIHTTDSMTGDDPLYGYRPVLEALVDRIGTALYK